jgi:hypothetical protein
MRPLALPSLCLRAGAESRRARRQSLHVAGRHGSSRSPLKPTTSASTRSVDREQADVAHGGLAPVASSARPTMRVSVPSDGRRAEGRRATAWPCGRARCRSVAGSTVLADHVRPRYRPCPRRHPHPAAACWRTPSSPTKALTAPKRAIGRASMLEVAVVSRQPRASSGSSARIHSCSPAAGRVFRARWRRRPMQVNL